MDGLNLHLLFELTRDIGAQITLPELPESIVALAAEKGTPSSRSPPAS
jgi:hypothetical protein